MRSHIYAWQFISQFALHWRLCVSYYNGFCIKQTPSPLHLFILIRSATVLAKVGVAAASSGWNSYKLSSYWNICDGEDPLPDRRLRQLVEKLLHQCSLNPVEIRQPHIFLLQPFKLLIIHQRISLHSLHLLLGIFPIQCFNLLRIGWR